MGNTARKLKRRKPQYTGITKIPFTSEAEANILANKVINTIGVQKIENYRDEQFRQKVYQSVVEQIREETIAEIMAACSNALMNDYGKIKSRETRLVTFFELVSKYIIEMELPSKQQIEAEREFDRQLAKYDIQLERYRKK